MERIKAELGELSTVWRTGLILLSFLCVAFGQPAWVPELGLLASAFGYALSWRALFSWPAMTTRFWIATAWFSAAQMVQASWMTSYEYQGIYILFAHPIVSAILGVQFGLFTLLVRRANIAQIRKLVTLCAIWILMEWGRLFVLSGWTFNPVGLALTGSIYPMQVASIGGMFGLSFLVIFTNLLALRVWALSDQSKPIALWLLVVIAPYLYGYGHINYHDARKGDDHIDALLVQTAFSPKPERFHGEPLEAYALGQWKQILDILAKDQGSDVDIIVLPEAAVPFGCYQPAYLYEEVKQEFQNRFGEKCLTLLPAPVKPLGGTYGSDLIVSNAFWAQSIANLFNADLVAGMDDYDLVAEKSFAAAFHFSSGESLPNRYEKRVLVVMGEYIPFEWCRSIAANYGIYGSYTPGTHAKVFDGGQTPPFGLSICYEETFGDLMRENRLQGAEVLVNVTNDGWYPNSKLPQQHFDLARIRSVENGVPCLRACNTGVTGGVDSLGNIVAVIDGEFSSEALLLKLPTYHYNTVYTFLGDGLVIGFALVSAAFALRFRLLTVL